MIEWKEIYNIYKAVLGNFITLSIAWESSGYRVSIIGTQSVTLKERFQEIEEAKKAAIRLAKRKINQALKELE